MLEELYCVACDKMFRSLAAKVRNVLNRPREVGSGIFVHFKMSRSQPQKTSQKLANFQKKILKISIQENHETSKKHRENIDKLIQEMEEEEKEVGDHNPQE